MIARNRVSGRRATGLGLAALAVLTFGSSSAHAQLKRVFGGGAKPTEPPAETKPTEPSATPSFKVTAVPVNPTDPIAVVNGQVITRQQLSDECVARKGKEILDTLINRTLIEQALKDRKLEITAAEIDEEIDNVAHKIAGIGREPWLRTLEKERGISPIQYARDIIYPALALRKLSSNRVQVTEQDKVEMFASQYGDKLRCRMIVVDKLAAAQQIWEELRSNPGGFEKIAQDRSMDNATRAMGGLIAEPIRRFASPRPVSDAAFRQLVDGDEADKDPNHKPKNGDVTGPIQVNETMWILLRREGLIPATQGYSLKDENVQKQMHDMVFEGKLKEQMGVVFQELVSAAAVENMLTGQVKMAHEENDPNYRQALDQDVKLMGGGPPETAPTKGATAGGRKLKTPTPVGVPAEEAARTFTPPKATSTAPARAATAPTKAATRK